MENKKYKIKLQPGDYCRRDMGEEKYREVAQRFFDDGCPECESRGSFKDCEYFGWLDGDGFYHAQFAMAGRLLTYDEVMELAEPDGEWDGEGLPPVGEKVLYTCVHTPSLGVPKGEWVSGTIIHYHDGFVWTSDNGLRALDNTKFRPLKSDRDKAIEAALLLDPFLPGTEFGILSRHDFCGVLFDAGLLRLPEDK